MRGGGEKGSSLWNAGPQIVCSSEKWEVGQSLQNESIIVKTPTLLKHKVGFDNKMTLQTPPHPTQPPQKLNISDISAVTDSILMQL